MTITEQIAYIVVSYLLGSIPTGYLLTKKFTGKNILLQGSGNIGSTNVGRVAGKKLSVLTQIADMIKGLLPVAIYLLFFHEILNDKMVFLVALSAILGHDFSVFLKFKGGKGVNTTLGASILLVPFSVMIAVLIYFIVKHFFKYVSLGSICLAFGLVLSGYLIHGIGLQFYYLLICMFLILVLHRANIIRLWNGEELKS